MSTRAISIRNLMLDGLFFAAIMIALGLVTTSFAGGAEPAAELVADVATDRRLTDDHIDSQLNTDDNMPSGNPTESAAEARETNILGMKLFEVRPGVTRVQDVTATSPAWDAGIRSGDQLLSIEGVKIRKLAPWVEDIAQLLDDKEDGRTVAAQVWRKDEQLDLRIKLPVSRAAEVRDARQEELAIAEMARKQGQGTGQPQQPGPTIVTGGAGERDYYGPGYGVGGGLVGGGVVDDSVRSENADDRMADRAVARLAAVNTFGSGAGGQVGLATFQASGSSVAVNVVVRGLPQGSYVVGIDDGGGMVGAGVGPSGGGYDGVGYDGVYVDPNDPNWAGDNGFDANGRVDRNTNGRRDRSDRRMNDSRMQNRQNQQPLPGQPNPDQQMPNQPRPQQQTPMPQQPVPQQPVGPAGPAAGGVGPAGGADGAAPAGGEGASLANPHGVSYLAQQIDPAMNPATARQPNRVVPNANRPNPAVTNPNVPTNRTNRSGNPNVNSANGIDNRPGVGGLGQPGGPQFLRELGVLNVGPDGSGQLQTRLDGIQVRSLAGLSVTVASTMSAGGNGVGPNGNADPRVASNTTNSNRIPRNSQERAAASAAAAQGGQYQAGPGIVATGVIQLVQGSGELGFGTGTEEENLDEPLDPATEEFRKRNFDASDPQQDFDPSNPREDFDPSQGTVNPERQNFDPADQPGAPADQDFDPAQ